MSADVVARAQAAADRTPDRANAVREALAAAICDRWFDLCGWAERWNGSASEEQRQTFRVMVTFAQAAGRQGDRDVESLAKALCAGFACDCAARAVTVRAWPALGESYREVFRQVASRMVERGRELQRERAA